MRKSSSAPPTSGCWLLRRRDMSPNGREQGHTMAHAIGDFLTQYLWTLLHGRDFADKVNSPATYGKRRLCR